MFVELDPRGVRRRVRADGGVVGGGPRALRAGPPRPPPRTLQKVMQLSTLFRVF